MHKDAGDRINTTHLPKTVVNETCFLKKSLAFWISPGDYKRNFKTKTKQFKTNYHETDAHIKHSWTINQQV
jgi:hypothetical protein